jgi:tRNA (mo5U34)-methyltransferase
MANDHNGCYWWHSIRLPDGSVTPGEKSPEVLEEEWRDLALPSLSEKTVLDIGAWDGWFSFAAERAGASRVVALDQFVWALDFSRGNEYRDYRARCEEAGQRPDLWGPDCAWWDEQVLPGKRGFDRAHQALGSVVESVTADFMTCDLDSVGTFDVVMFLGVLYHLKEPHTALERLRRVTKELAIIETAAISLAGNDDERPLLEALPECGINGDPTNWFIPTEAALHVLLKRAQFSDVKTVSRSYFDETRPGVTDFRLTVHATP